MLGPILLTAHNLTFYQRLMVESRGAIESDRFPEFLSEKLAKWGGEIT
jgi:queuine tRNA-ribosyltransferase